MADHEENYELPWLPEARVLNLPGHGEMFIRHHCHADPRRPTLLLLHGWTASTDLQFFTAYEALAAEYSFVGIDHRGHGRGARPPQPFALEDVADDAAAVVRALGLDRVVVVGYSMGGPISMLFAQRHPDLVSGLVVEATALEWRASPRERLTWRWLPILGAFFRSRYYTHSLRRVLTRMIGVEHSLHRYMPWILGEIGRNDVHSLIAAGRSLSRYDARDWAPTLGMPAAMLITAGDRLVKPRKQWAVATALHAKVREVQADHLCPWEEPEQFAAVTLALVDDVVARATFTDRPPVSGALDSGGSVAADLQA